MTVKATGQRKINVQLSSTLGDEAWPWGDGVGGLGGGGGRCQGMTSRSSNSYDGNDCVYGWPQGNNYVCIVWLQRNNVLFGHREIIMCILFGYTDTITCILFGYTDTITCILFGYTDTITCILFVWLHGHNNMYNVWLHGHNYVCNV